MSSPMGMRRNMFARALGIGRPLGYYGPTLIVTPPVIEEAFVIRRRPVFNWGFIAAALLVFIVSKENGAWRELFVFIPDDRWRLLGSTWLTYTLQHANPAHLLGNLYYLFMFGRSLEDLFSTEEFAFFFAACAAGGALGHLLGPMGDASLIGASGAISGVMAYFALEFPKAKVTMGITLEGERFGLPVGIWLLGWILLQIVGGLLVSGNIAYFAHLGGALTGFLYWLFLRAKPAPVSRTAETAR